MGFKQGPSFYAAILFPTRSSTKTHTAGMDYWPAWERDWQELSTKLGPGIRSFQPLREWRLGSLNTDLPKTASRVPEQNDSCCCLPAYQIRLYCPAGQKWGGGMVNKKGLVIEVSSHKALAIRISWVRISLATFSDLNSKTQTKLYLFSMTFL